MSRTTKQINKISGTVISISLRLIIVAAVILISIRCVTIAYSFGHEIFYPSSVENAPGTDINITIEKGTTTKQAAQLLESKGLITNTLSFEVQARFFDLHVKSGTYTLNTSQTSRQILETLDGGDNDFSGTGDSDTQEEIMPPTTEEDTETVPQVENQE